MKPFAQLPDVLALTDSINTKTAARIKITADVDALNAQIANGQTEDNDSHVEAALHYVVSGEFAQSVGGAAFLHQRRNVLQKQVKALDSTLKADREVLRDLQRSASATASKEVEAAHRSIASDALKAIRAFDAACAAEQALVAELGANGYDATFRHPVQWFHIGRLQDVSSSAVWHFERSLSAYAKK